VQAAPHGQDALAHRGHVGFPLRAQRGVGQHAADELPAAWMGGLE
jgi:hypothetical protein